MDGQQMSAPSINDITLNFASTSSRSFPLSVMLDRNTKINGNIPKNIRQYMWMTTDTIFIYANGTPLI